MDGEPQTGVTAVGIMPLRRQPRDASEMVSQLLLGEMFEILDSTERWYEIKAAFDGYRGWVNQNECYVLKSGSYNRWQADKDDNLRFSVWYSFRAYGEDSRACTVPPGARFEINDSTIRLPFGEFKISGGLTPLKGQDILQTARNFLGTPYLWGGRSDCGIDCSGLIQQVLKLHGWSFPRDSSEQAKAVPLCELKSWNDLAKGDVLYFNPGGNAITHVGFYLGKGLLLHASGCVRVQALSRGWEREWEQKYTLNANLANSIAGYQKLNEIKTLEKTDNYVP